MKLITMTDYVLNQAGRYRPHKKIDLEMANKLDWIEKYATFLSQPLTLGMFIPCDLEDNVLEKQNHKAHPSVVNGEMFKEQTIKIQEAKDRVLFEGVKMSNGFGTWWICLNGQARIDIKKGGRRIESLTEYDLTLTPNAVKQIGL